MDKSRIRTFIEDLPVVGEAATHALRRIKSALYPGSESYWRRHYAAGGDSGPGSHLPHLVAFKAEVVNRLVEENRISSVIELGCGDGNQLAHMKYRDYLGIDVSPDAVERCRLRFSGDRSMHFKVARDYAGESADLTLSLDVIYHLTEEEVFEAYMTRLFTAARRMVVIYSTDMEKPPTPEAPHVRHRQFSRWVRSRAPGWVPAAKVRNPHGSREDRERDIVPDFFVYRSGRDY